MIARGFTTIELLVTTAIIVIIFGLGAGVFSLIAKTAAEASGTNAIEYILGSAARRARAGTNASDWGVYLPYDDTTRQTNTVVVFSGTSYATRDLNLDVNYRFNEGVRLTMVDFSGASSPLGNDHEIIFNALTGQTTQYGSITIDLYGDAFTIIITEDGFITLE